MKTFNRPIIIGRLGQDPELKGDVAMFTVSNSTIRDGVEEVMWHKIRAFGNQAKLCVEYLHKGDLCCIEGTLSNHTYEKDGKVHHSQSIIVERITFLASKR